MNCAIKSYASHQSLNPIARDCVLFICILLLSFVAQTLAASAQQKKPDDPATLIAEARALWQNGQQWVAIDKMKKAILLQPGNAVAHTELAQMYLRVKSNDLAGQAVAEALRLDPNYPAAHQAKAVVLSRAGDFDEAIREARLALTLKPDNQVAAYSHLTIGRSLMKLKRNAEADEEFRQAIAVYHDRLRGEPNDASTQAAMGDLLFELQRYDEAENSYRRAVEMAPQNFNLLLDLGGVLHNQGKKDEAIRSYQEYLRLKPNAANKTDIEARIKWLDTTPAATVLGYLLVHAAENGNLSNLKALLSKGADVNFKDAYKTSLNTAAREGHLEIVKVLLAQSAKDEDGAALAAAYEAGHSEIEKLLEHATSEPLTPKAVNRLLYAALRRGDAKKFASVLESATQKDRDELLLYAVSQTKAPPIEIVHLLLKKGAQVNQPTQYKSALMHAASNGHVAIAELLLSQGAEVDVQTNEGTALMLAVMAGHTEIVKLLLAAGADAKATHRTGDHILIMAARAGHDETKGGPASERDLEIMQLLLAKGADPNARGAWRSTALMFANTPAKVTLLVANGAELEAKDEQGETALIKAAARGQADVVNALLSKAADVNLTDDKGNSALLRALENDNTRYGEEARKLVERRLETARRILLAKDLKVDAHNLDGETPLMRAVRLDNIELVKSLLAKGADANRSDVFGYTAVILAYENGNSEIESMLPRASLKLQAPAVLNAFLTAAIGKKDQARVEELLAEGANPNHEYAIGYTHKEIKRTVLILAASMGHPGIVQMLLNKGANVNAQGLIYGSESGLKFGTALEAAEFSKHAEIAAMLRKVVNATSVKN